MKTVHPRSRAQWRAWLEANHASATEVWIIFDKKGTGRQGLSYADAVEEAICFGWIDGVVKRIDDAQHIQRYTPRKKVSNWSAVNRRRFVAMVDAGSMTQAGIDAGPHKAAPLKTRWSVDEPVPAFIDRALKGVARRNFEALPRGERERYVRWVIEAKQEATRKRRLAQALEKLARNERRYV